MREGAYHAGREVPDRLRDLPSGAGLLALGREKLLEQMLPLLPPERHRELRLVATAMAIAERELSAGNGPGEEISMRLEDLYGLRASRRHGDQGSRAPEKTPICAASRPICAPAHSSDANRADGSRVRYCGGSRY